MSNTLRILLRYEWITFTRNTYQIVMLCCTFLLGLYSIYYGQSEIKVQRDTIRDVIAIEKKEFDEYRTSFQEKSTTESQKKKLQIASDPAYAWHRHGYHAILHPHDYAALAIGQYDLHPYYYRLTGMSLHYQIFENEIANPVKLFVGNFDVSFLLIYLFPLLIIAFSYGLYSGEKENGVLPLLNIQSISIRRIIVIRLLFYFFLITSLALLISLIGLFVSGDILASENSLAAFFWMFGVVLYCAFWFAILFFIVSFKMNSSFTAISAAGIWLLFLVIIPSILNVWVTTKYPLDSTSLAEITRRTSLENEEDVNEAKEVIYEFIAHNPGFKGSEKLIHNNTMAKAYAALTALKDMHCQKDVDHYNNQISYRNQWVSGFHWINPAVNMQSIFTHITKTDLSTFRQFHKAIELFHSRISYFYFRKLFWDKSITEEDYLKLPTLEIQTDTVKWGTLIVIGMLKVSSAMILFFGIGFIMMKNKKI